jgi:uncharacterized alkaline shock family protein YloU
MPECNEALEFTVADLLTNSTGLEIQAVVITIIGIRSSTAQAGSWSPSQFAAILLYPLLYSFIF